MKILWMVNIVLPRIAKKTGIKAENYGGGVANRYLKCIVRRTGQ